VKRGLYGPNGMCGPNPQRKELDSKEKVYFYQEDIEDPGKDATLIPWRRVYGPALNSWSIAGFFLGHLL